MRFRARGKMCLSVLALAASTLLGAVPAVQAYEFGDCRWFMTIGYAKTLYYYNGAAGVAQRPTELAFQAWYDMPVPLHFVPATSEIYANILVYEIGEATPGPAPGQTPPPNCDANGFITSQVYINIYDTFPRPDGSCCEKLSAWAEDKVVGVVAHEIGHALGLAHNGDEHSLMYGTVDPGQPRPSYTPYDLYHIFVPTFDDIQGLAGLYGWSPSNRFASSMTSGGASVSGTTPPYGAQPPLTLQVLTPASNTYATVFSSTSLPSSGIAVMIAQITPTTLYRFNIGWQRASLTSPFATLELDNDGIKIASSVFFTGYYTISNTPPSLITYFLELILMRSGDDVRATALVYQGDIVIGTSNFVTSQMVGLWGAYPYCCVISQSWSDAQNFSSSVWTDTASNPASNYRLDHFWNFQGDHCMKFGCGGGGGSPHLSTWDGRAWLLDNNLMPAAEHSNAHDVTDYYRIQQPLANLRGYYRLRISEFENAHNYVDQVRLLTVDHGSSYRIAVSSTGQILTYANPVPARLVVTQNGTDVTSLLESPDEAFYTQSLQDALYLNFSSMAVRDTAKLLVRSDPFDPCSTGCKKSWFDISVMAPNGSWIDVGDVFPRIYWAYDIVDLSPILPSAGSQIIVRISFDNANGHRIDFAGLDTTSQQSVTVREAILTTATHSRSGEITTAVMNDERFYAEIVPGESITFTYKAARQAEEVRDFVIVTNGFYVPVAT